jgi:hypothetical protein
MDYRARYYDPYLARFVSADTVVADYANPQTLNRYAYTANNPVKYVDPSGNCHGLSGAAFDACVKAVVAIASGVHKANEYRDDIFFPDANTTFADRLEASTVVGGSATVFAAGVAEVAFGTLTTAATTGGATAVGGTGATATTAACADGDCTNEAQLTAQLTSKVIEKEWTILGKYPVYLEQAEKFGQNAFSISDSEWAKLPTRAAQWARNVQFLDESIERGDVFRLATPFAEGWKETGTFFKDELAYILQKGYELQTLHGVDYLVKATESSSK